jgi:hypothetical protein
MSGDSASLTKATFDAHLGERFVMRVSADRVIALELIETEMLPTAPDATRTAFRLRFRAPEIGPVPQLIYSLEHATLGTLEVFLMPVGSDSVGALYDAVFS